MSETTALIFRNGQAVRVGLDQSVPQDDESSFIWIEVRHPQDSDFALLRERFRLHALAVDDSMSPRELPKLDVYDDQIFTVLKLARLQGDEIKYADIDAFVAVHHIITVRRDDGSGGVAPLAGRIQRRSGALHVRPDLILHEMMESAVGDYFPVVQMIEDEVLAMEQRVLDAFLSRDEVTRLFQLRREAIRLQHVLARMSDVCAKLANLDVPSIRPEIKPYFRDVHDQIARVNAMIDGLIDVIKAVFEASNLLEQQRQGAITRQLAGWAAILGVPTAIAGIYSMNSKNWPELYGALGHSAVIAGMAAVCVALYIRFRKLGWL